MIIKAQNIRTKLPPIIMIIVRYKFEHIMIELLPPKQLAVTTHFLVVCTPF